MAALLDHLAIALLEEARVCGALRDLAPETRPIAGGSMSRGVPGLWYNVGYGMGLQGSVTRDDARALAEFHSAAGIEPRIKACTLADRSLYAALGDEGFVLKRFETVYARSLEGAADRAEAAPDPAEIALRRVDPAHADDVETYARLAVASFSPAQGAAREAQLEALRRMLRHPGVDSALALVDGGCVGVAAMAISGELAAFISAATKENSRGRGVQTALMRWRLRTARERGARWVTVSSSPGVATERNARRLGFEMAYARAILVRPEAGLAPVIE